MNYLPSMHNVCFAVNYVLSKRVFFIANLKFTTMSSHPSSLCPEQCGFGWCFWLIVQGNLFSQSLQSYMSLLQGLNVSQQSISKLSFATCHHFNLGHGAYLLSSVLLPPWLLPFFQETPTYLLSKGKQGRRPKCLLHLSFQSITATSSDLIEFCSHM